MLALTSVCIALTLGLLAQQWLHLRQAREREDAFRAEREAWASERRDLNTRIQMPQAAPFLFEDDPEAAKNDRPVMPEFEMDEAELEKAKRELAEVGYELGPAG